MIFLIAQVPLIVYNAVNSYIDAYKFLRNNTVAHGVNGGLYILFTIIIWHVFNISDSLVLFLLSAFFQRQLTFDIPLNLRRGLDWYYQSTANPPKAIVDRIERFIFGTGKYIGKEIAALYFLFYVATIITSWLI